MGLFSFFRKKNPVAVVTQQERDYVAEGLTPERREAARASLKQFRAPNPAWDEVTAEAAISAHAEFLKSRQKTKQ